MKSLRSPVDRALREVLAKAREKAGLNQEDVARRLGRRQPYISKIETGERAGMYVPELVAIAEAIGADAGKLLDEAIRLAKPNLPTKRPPRKRRRK